MRHPHEKFIVTEIVSIVSAVFIGIIGFIKGYHFLIFIALYLIALSLFCDVFIKWSTHNKTQAIKQFTRAITILFITTYLLFKL